MCIYSINTRFDAILKSSYLQKSSLCKRVLGKSFVLFHAERFSTEAERKHVRVKEAERRDETSCLWVANTFEIADIKAWRMRSTLSLSLFSLSIPWFPHVYRCTHKRTLQHVSSSAGTSIERMILLSLWGFSLWMSSVQSGPTNRCWPLWIRGSGFCHSWSRNWKVSF